MTVINDKLLQQPYTQMDKKWGHQEFLMRIACKLFEFSWARPFNSKYLMRCKLNEKWYS